MAPAQMALPIDRRNGASAARPSPAPELGPLVVGPSAAVHAGVVPVWVRRVTTLAVLAVAIVAAVASYEHMRSLAELAGEGWRSSAGRPGVRTVRPGAVGPLDGSTP
jgi:hypothetical protein